MSFGYATWKIVYSPVIQDNGYRGVALVEATSRAHAMSIFQQEYAGQYHVVDSCTLLG